MAPKRKFCAQMTGRMKRPDIRIAPHTLYEIRVRITRPNPGFHHVPPEGDDVHGDDVQPTPDSTHKLYGDT